jgi:hypothetical protein
MQDGQLFPKPQLVVDLIRPLVHHKPMNLLTNTERLGLLKEPSLRPGASHDEARQHLQVLEARNEVHEDFLAKHVTSWSQLSKDQSCVMLNFFVSCALLSEIDNRRGTYLVTARLRNLPSVQQLASPAAHPAVPPNAADLSSEMQERLDISQAREDMMSNIQRSLQPFMQPSHCAAQVMPLILGTSHVSDHQVLSQSDCILFASNQQQLIARIRTNTALKMFHDALCQAMQVMLHEATAFKSGKVNMDKTNTAAKVLDGAAGLADGIPIASFVLKSLSFVVNTAQGLKFDACMQLLIRRLFPDLDTVTWSSVVRKVAQSVTIAVAPDIEALYSGTEDDRSHITQWFLQKCSDYGFVYQTSKAEDAVAMMALKKVEEISHLALSKSFPSDLSEEQLSDFIVSRIAPSASPLVASSTSPASAYNSHSMVSPALRVRANEAFFLLPIRHIAVLARLQARMVQAQPRGISVNMLMFSDGVIISRGKSLCAAVVRGWRPNERSPKLRDRVVNLDCVLHLVSNDDGMFRFMSRCIESIIETAFAGLRYECWCPVRDQHGNTVDWMQFDGGSSHAIAQSLSSTLEEKNIFDVIFDGQQLHQLFALCCPIFISHAWNDGTILFVKRLKRHIETQALVSVWCDYLQLNQQQGAVEVKFREGLCKASVILVCLTPRYLTRPNCLRELQWSLDFAYKTEKDVRILPLHPALTFAGIQAIAQHGCVCVSNSDGTHKVLRLSAKAVELVVKLKQYMCLNWSDLEPWASDALGESWPEQSLAADGSVRASMVGLGDELVKNISDKLGFNDLPSKVGDCKELEDKDLEASAVADADIPVNLLDSYPELSPAFRQRVQDCSDRNKRVADAIARHRSASTALAAGASAAAQPPPLALVSPAAPSSTVHSINIQGIFVKTKSHLFPLFSKSRR